MGNMEEAEEYYLKFLAETLNDPLLESSANSGLAASGDNNDNLSAANYYMKASVISTGKAQSEAYLLSSIRNYYKSGEIERAKEMIDDMLADEDLNNNSKESAEYWRSIILGTDG